MKVTHCFVSYGPDQVTQIIVNILYVFLCVVYIHAFGSNTVYVLHSKINAKICYSQTD